MVNKRGTKCRPAYDIYIYSCIVKPMSADTPLMLNLIMDTETQSHHNFTTTFINVY